MTATGLMWCPHHEKPEPAAPLYCESGVELVPLPVPDEGPDDIEDEDDDEPRFLSQCWLCRHDSPDARNRNCLTCRESLAAPDLAIVYGDRLAVPLDRPAWVGQTSRASRADLGRAGDYGHIYQPFHTVSRRHAVIEVDSSGRGWVEPIPQAPNGTWINGQEIFRRAELRARDVMWLAQSGPEGRIRQPSRE